MCGQHLPQVRKMLELPAGLRIAGSNPPPDPEIHRRHPAPDHDRFRTLSRQARILYPDCLPMAAGSCTICQQCTYPDRPCRFPDRMFPSMEACGLVINDVCRDSGMPYDYGAGTITYTSCILTC